MTTFRLPVFRENLDHRYNIVLDGQTVTMEFHLNRRANRWNMSLIDVDNNPIRNGIRLVVGIDLLQRIALATNLPGLLQMVDTTGQNIEPDADTFGVESRLRYTEAADL